MLTPAGMSPVAEPRDCLESPLGRGGAGLHRAPHVFVERGHREGDGDAAVGRQLGQDVEVAGDERALRDDAHGIAELGEHVQAPAGELKPPLDRLIRIGHTTHREQPGLPRPARQLGPQQLRGARLDEDARLEIEPGRQAEVLVRGPRVAVDAAVLAAAVGIHAAVERHVGTRVRRDDRPGGVVEIERRHAVCRRGIVGVAGLVGLGVDVQDFEASRRIQRRAARVSRRRTTCAAGDWHGAFGHHQLRPP